MIIGLAALRAEGDHGRHCFSGAELRATMQFGRHGRPAGSHGDLATVRYLESSMARHCNVQSVGAALTMAAELVLPELKLNF